MPMLIGSGTSGCILIGRERTKGDLVAIKVANNVPNEATGSIFHEFMYQEQAHSVLQGKSCSTPRPIGFLRMKNSSDKVQKYALVSEFCCVVPNVGVGMTLTNAYSWNNHNPFITTEEWRDICLALLEAVETFMTWRIFHLDIKSDNIMLHFPKPQQQALNQWGSSEEQNVSPHQLNASNGGTTKNRVELKIIDYGSAESGNKPCLFMSTPNETPQVPPELCYFRNGLSAAMGDKSSANNQYSNQPTPIYPHPTSDLHGVAYVISTISKHLNMVDLSKAMELFMLREPQQRELDYLKKCVERHFNEFIQEKHHK